MAQAQHETSLKPDRLLHPAVLFPNISAGAVNGILIVIFQSAYAALIFSGELSPFIARGIGFMLFGAFAMGIIVGLTSSFFCTVTAPQDAPTAILALAAAGICANLAISGTPEEAFITTIAVIALTALTTGLVLLTIGTFQLGNLIRFIPYPVIGGFLAGTGWILFSGAIRIMSGYKLSLANLPHIFQEAILYKWFPGVAFAVILYVVLRKVRVFWIMPAMILGATVIFYLILYFLNVDTLSASKLGWLLPRFQEGLSWQPLSPAAYQDVQWSWVFQETGNMVTVVLISVISLLLNASGLELIARREIDLNQELRAAGAANLVSGLGGSSAGYMSLSLSALGYRIGASNRLAVFTSAGICGLTLFFGPGISAYFPKFLLGGLLFYLGLSFIMDWLYYSWFKLPKGEYFLVVLIVITIGFMGLLQGIALGLMIAGLLFVINYSRINIIKHTLSGSTFQSNVDRAAPIQRFLREKGGQLLVLKLQGYIFFGTANSLLDEMRQHARQAQDPPIRYVLMDFRLVNGLDSSALNSFAKLKILQEAYGIIFILTGLSKDIQRQFSTIQLIGDGDGFHHFQDLDHGMEWCENQILAETTAFGEQLASPETIEFLSDLLQQTNLDPAAEVEQPDRDFSRRILKYIERQHFSAGDYLIRKGQSEKLMYIIVSGQVTAQLEDNGKLIRLRRMGAGTVVGELGIYLGMPATASVVANQDCEVLCMPMAQLRKMELEAPALAADFHKLIARILGERLVNSNKIMQALLR